MLIATNFNPFGDSPAGDGPVPSVDPADFRSIWAMQNGVPAHPPGQQIAISADSYKSACSQGADVGAVYTRVSQLHLLQMLGMLAPWIHDGLLDDAAFKVAATFPMKRMQVGIVYNELPFDVQEFMKQIEKQIAG